MKSSGSGVGLSFFFCLFIFFIVLNLIDPSFSVHVCKPQSCSEMGPPIRFPFSLRGKHKDGCGYPGFELSCNNQSQTILTLPHSGDFVVKQINYKAQAIYFRDPDSCLPKRIVDFSVVGSPFRAVLGRNYTYLNCSDWAGYSYLTNGAVPLFCLSDNYMVMAMPSSSSSIEPSSSCHLIPNVSAPLPLSYAPFGSGMAFSENLKLTWGEPGCQSCELKNMYCGFDGDTGLEIGCAKPPRRGLSRGAKYGVIIGVGIPGFVFLIGVACYTCGKVRDFGIRRSLNNELSTAEMNPPQSLTVTGLDAPTIESYPKTVVGESRRLPKPSDDGTCPICLSEYQPKETIRSIPECNHYFHATCVDEWLKLNGTCPLCRNSPESMSMTPCSSMSSTFSTSSA